jgi:hypothetical protein
MAAINVWKALIRPVLEYAAEVVDYGDNGEWKEADRIQLSMAKRILGVPPTTADAAVRGELGWWTLKGRRDMLRLRYWGKLTRMPSKRWTRRIYAKSRQQFEQGEKTWCSYTHKLLRDLGLERVWETEETGEPAVWNARVFEAINGRETAAWKEEVKTKPKLRTYALLKKELLLEPYLESSTNTAGRKLMSVIRTGTNSLRIETGRHWDPKLPEERRTCWCCGIAVEDEEHFVVQCAEYAEERAQLFESIGKVTEGRLQLQKLAKAQPSLTFKLLVGEGLHHKQQEVHRCVQTFLVRAMNKRRQFLQRAWGESRGG